MGTTNEENERVVEARQERGALLVSLATVALIAVVGAPCFCYFGIGLFQGIHVLRTGQQNNPARQTLRRHQYERAPQFERRFAPDGTPLPPAPATTPPGQTSPPEPPTR